MDHQLDDYYVSDEVDVFHKSSLKLCNSTTPSPYVISKEDIFVAYLKTVLQIINLIGGLTDVLLIFLLLTTKKCRTRTFLIHMCANEALVLLGIHRVLGHILPPPIPLVFCFLEHYVGIFLSAYLLFLGAAQINAIMLTKRINTKLLVTIIYAIAFSFGIFRVLVCISRFSKYNENMKLITAILIITVIVVRIYKDLSYCWMRNSPLLDDDEIIRINIVRIFVYVIVTTLAIACIAFLIVGKDHLKTILPSLHIFYGLRPVIIVAYIWYARKKMHMQLPHFSFNKIKYDLESTTIISSDDQNNVSINQNN